MLTMPIVHGITKGAHTLDCIMTHCIVEIENGLNSPRDEGKGRTKHNPWHQSIVCIHTTEILQPV